ncbi:Beta-galactosidase 7, partial [Nowakowskiella sp. JEL0078]
MPAVTYNNRAIIVNNIPKLLWVGSIHYPRSTPKMWPLLLERSKHAGINAVDTYVFWNQHEEEEGIYDFETGNKNLPKFLEEAQSAGLDVVLRIGPYVCAEFNYGGFPTWLLKKKGIEFRTYNKIFMDQMERFIVKTIEVIRPYLASNGGPIILLQMENEYITFQWFNFPRGHLYIQWAANLAKRLDVGVPWFMCEQGNIRTLLNTYNGHYADDRISKHKSRFPNQPAMYTEL